MPLSFPQLAVYWHECQFEYNGFIIDLAMEITKRQNQLLDFLIREYVKTAKPIPSALITKKSKLRVSPATIRSEMNALEKAGFLEQKHTSGGRVPTDKAYRYFVNNVVANEGTHAIVPAREQQQIKLALANAGQNPMKVNKNLAEVLSKASENLVITGIDDSEPNFFKVGLASLFELPEFRELDRIFQLTNFFEEFDNMFHIFEERIGQARPNQIQVYIGKENPMKQVKGETIITARYPLPGNYTGILTLIGPTRMDYEKNIALIKYTTEQLKQHKEEDK